MQYFRNTENEIFAYDDEQVSMGYGSDLIPITEADVKELQKPTPEQQREMDRAALKQERDKLLSEITHTFADGAVVQVRPDDLANINVAIQQNMDTKWVMQDNSVRLVTVQELKEAMQTGIVKGKAIWDSYMSKLEVL